MEMRPLNPHDPLGIMLGAMNNGEILARYFELENSNGRDFLSGEVIRRSETDKKIFHHFLPLFDHDKTRVDIVYMLLASHDPTLIPAIGEMIQKLFRLEAERGVANYEVLRMTLYQTLSSYANEWQLTLPILLYAVSQEEWHNNVLDELVNAIVAIGPNAIPNLKQMLAAQREYKPFGHGPGCNIKLALTRSLEGLGVSNEEIDRLVMLNTKGEKRRRWGLF